MCNGEFVDLIIYNVTKRFEKIDLMPNVRNYQHPLFIKEFIR